LGGMEETIMGTPLETAGVVVFVLLMLFIIYNSNICPKCKRRWATKKTGERKGAYGIVQTPGFFEGEEEVKCKYCGDRHWRHVGPKT